MSTKAVSKILSANDTGDTGGHQAGMLVQKDPEILSFFPSLDEPKLNPRRHLVFYDDANQRWEFAFIFYNNRFFGGTRNEYRLTRMTRYIRHNNLKPGDEVILRREEGGKRTISYRRAKGLKKDAQGRLVLSSGWKIIDI